VVESGRKWLNLPKQFLKDNKNMFKGKFLHSIDAKGRISIPAKLRKYITPNADNTFVMTQGNEKCIDMYPKDNWMVIENDLYKLDTFDISNANFVRLMLSNAHEDEMDSQYRILVPRQLLEFAEIKNEVIILGSLRKIELWNPEILKSHLENLLSNKPFNQIAQEVMKGNKFPQTT